MKRGSEDAVCVCGLWNGREVYTSCWHRYRPLFVDHFDAIVHHAPREQLRRRGDRRQV